MNNQTIVCCVVALLLGMLLANMLKSVCGCKLTEGQLIEINPDFVVGDSPSMDCLPGMDCGQGGREGTIDRRGVGEGSRTPWSQGHRKTLQGSTHGSLGVR
jgi:hypothetical protein